MGMRRSAVVQRACRIRAYVARLIARSTNVVEGPQEHLPASMAGQGEVDALAGQEQTQANEEWGLGFWGGGRLYTGRWPRTDVVAVASI